MIERIDNFNAGPASIPTEVLERAQRELMNFQNTGMSVMELSHRSKAYEKVHEEAKTRVLRLLGLSDAYSVLFLQGGASTQFAMLPMNFLGEGKAAGYVLTGSWSEKAAEEAKRFGKVYVDQSAKSTGYQTIPSKILLDDADNLEYVHITTNNTIYGTQWHQIPDTEVPIVADMSSDILSRPVDANRFHMIYAGAQKNLGPAGVTLVAVRKDWLAGAQADLPTMLRYHTHEKAGSLYNTPPTFSIYLMNLVLEWIEAQGGVAAIGRRNEEKARLIYDVIDQYASVYVGHAETTARSQMNVTFRMVDDTLSDAFLQASQEKQFVGIKGHRSVGGFRVSLYNAVTVESAGRFAEFMRDFARKHL